MKKYFLIYITMVLASCGGPQGIIVSEAEKETFKKNYEAFEKYHLGKYQKLFHNHIMVMSIIKKEY